jgi:hypothetical protein
MKIKLLFTFLVFFVGLSASYASFPVKRATVATAEVAENSVETSAEYYSPAASGQKDKWVGVALWFFLGWPFAAHRWYYKKPVGWNILYIVTIAGLGIWAIVDLINILTDNF